MYPSFIIFARFKRLFYRCFCVMSMYSRMISCSCDAKHRVRPETAGVQIKRHTFDHIISCELLLWVYTSCPCCLLFSFFCFLRVRISFFELATLFQFRVSFLSYRFCVFALWSLVFLFGCCLSRFHHDFRSTTGQSKLNKHSTLA